MGNNPQGVTQIFKPKGTFRTNYSYKDNGGDSDRFTFTNPPTNFEFTGYFRGDGDDTVSCKIKGGTHNDGVPDDGCCYIPEFPTNGGAMEYEVECPHPDNHDCPCTRDADVNPLVSNRFTGYKVIAWNTPQNCVHWEAWQDKGQSGNGDNGPPANNWVKVAHHDDCTGNCGNIDSPLLKPKGDTSQATWRIDECGLNEDDGTLISIVEIEPGVLDDGTTVPGGGGTPTTPGGGDIPDPDQPTTIISKEWVDVWHVSQDAGESCTTSGNITPADLDDLWDLSPTTPVTYMDLFTGSINRAGIYIRNQSSRLWNTIPKEWTFTVQKFGTPTGVIKLVEWDWNGTLQAIFEKQIGSDINVGTLTTGVDTAITIQDLDNEERIKADHVFFLEYVGGDVNNKIRVRQTDIDYLDSSDTCFAYTSSTATWTRSPSRDLPCKIRGTAA